jgi:hypothetical protein
MLLDPCFVEASKGSRSTASSCLGVSQGALEDESSRTRLFQGRIVAGVANQMEPSLRSRVRHLQSALWSVLVAGDDVDLLRPKPDKLASIDSHVERVRPPDHVGYLLSKRDLSSSFNDLGIRVFAK